MQITSMVFRHIDCAKIAPHTTIPPGTFKKTGEAVKRDPRSKDQKLVVKFSCDRCGERIGVVIDIDPVEVGDVLPEATDDKLSFAAESP